MHKETVIIRSMFLSVFMSLKWKLFNLVRIVNEQQREKAKLER